MHWAYEHAERLIKEHPEREEFVCASGISPSGDVHIGNFREVLTTYFVVQALRKKGKKAKFIFSWDDFDRFRKVPKGLPESYEEYIGMAYSEIPDPYGCCESYAKHYENAFEASMEAFGIQIDYIYQSIEYTKGRYSEDILHAMNKRKEIYDIIMAYKTSDWDQEERANYYPIALYCHKCGKDHTQVNGYNDENYILDYTCACGHRHIYNIKDARNIKLIWKVDWPMRWSKEGVIFEPAGKDHSSMGGSFQVASEIAKKIFNYEPPCFLGYEFINIKGGQGKMSSSQGNLMTPEELLRVYTPEVILYIFLKNNPSTAFNFGFDHEVIKNYTEYERTLNAVRCGRITDEEPLHTCIDLSMTQHSVENRISFGKLAGILPLLDFNIEATRDVLTNNENIDTLGDIEVLSGKVEYWIKTWYPEKRISCRKERDIERLASLSSEEQEWIARLLNSLECMEDKSIDEQMKILYAITRTEDKKETKRRQKQFFALLYQLIIDQKQGPRLPLLFQIVGYKGVSKLLTT